MSPLVTIIDYGMGNLLSVAKAFEYCGADVRVSDLHTHVVDADILVLPGVGAFAKAMEELNRKGLDVAIKEFAAKERPFLGICLGMQLMHDQSEEFGIYQGLGLIPGVVEAIDSTDTKNIPHKIPHIGWAEVVPPTGFEQWADTIFQKTEIGTAFYFVHSFTAVPEHAEHRLADASYDGRLISAAVRSGSLYGCQFHPEKSGREGLRLIEHFLRL
jgi:imidazole glycerol-phosphate synthase subunit HisH